MASAFQLAAAAGAVIGAVGAVTGNKTLMAVGAVIGLAGAVGGFVSSLGGAAADVGAGVAEGATAAGSATGGATVGAEGVVNANGLDGALGDAASSSGAMAADAAAPATSSAASVVDGANMPPLPEASPLVNANTGMASVADGTNMPALPTTNPLVNTTAASSVADGTNMPSLSTANAPAPSNTFADTSGNAGGFDGGAGDAGNPNSAANGPLTNSPNRLSNNQLPGSAVDNPTTGAGAFDKLSGMFNGLGKFVAGNKELSAMILSGFQNAADPSQRNLRDAQSAQLQAQTANSNFIRANSMTTPVVNWGNAANPGMMQQPRVPK